MPHHADSYRNAEGVEASPALVTINIEFMRKATGNHSHRNQIHLHKLEVLLSANLVIEYALQFPLKNPLPEKNLRTLLLVLSSKSSILSSLLPPFLINSETLRSLQDDFMSSGIAGT